MSGQKKGKQGNKQVTSNNTPKNVLPGELKNIPLSELVGMENNPNYMSDVEFNRLCKELDTTGVIDPIQVVPLDDGKYRVLGGHQRVAAAKVLGWETIPCIVLTDEKFKDEDLQKFICMRLNVIRGRIDPKKFAQLYDELSERYADEALQDLMGYTDKSKWEELTKGVKEALIASGVPKNLVDKFDKETQEIKTIDDLAIILNTIFSNYGNTLVSDFIVFSYPKSDKMIIYVQVQRDVFDEIKEKLNECFVEGESANDFFKKLLELAKKEEKKDNKNAIVQGAGCDPF